MLVKRSYPPWLGKAEQVEAERIFASYRSELLEPKSDLEDLFDENAGLSALRREGLWLLACAGIADVPERFDGSELVWTIRHWKRELPEQELGPKPPTADIKALQDVNAAARRLLGKLDNLDTAIAAPASRIPYSGFTWPWSRERVAVLCRDLRDLAAATGDRDTVENMRRPDILPGRPPNGWSAREGFLGHDLPALYRQMLGRRFTASGKEDAAPSEGVRFARVVAFEVLGKQVEPGSIAKARTRYRAAWRGGQSTQE